jgi:hypothetical protein
MVPWRMTLGVLFGAVLVKESRRAGRAYDLIREKLVVSLGKFRAKTEDPDAAADDGRNAPSVSAACN